MSVYREWDGNWLELAEREMYSSFQWLDFSGRWIIIHTTNETKREWKGKFNQNQILMYMPGNRAQVFLPGYRK
ncbi:hypothetical protein J14TS5_53120 [Paenibacillus lautus]|nr:hypothetical protein J14TS5_53120 [Paenibacillus lautus]